MAKKTAVEWLQEGLETVLSHEQQMQVIGLFEQAKAMEREQIVEAVDSVELVNRRYYKDGTFGDDKAGKEVPCEEGREYIGLSTTGEKYFNKTYGGENV
jgi:hypothetical protein